MNPFYVAMLDVDEERQKLIEVTEGIEKYFKYVLAITKFSKEEITQHTRKREVVEKRQQVIYLLRGLGHPERDDYDVFNVNREDIASYMFSLMDIGVLFRKDHATVLYSCKAILNLKETNRHFRDKINRMERYMIDFHTEQVHRQINLKNNINKMDHKELAALFLNKIKKLATEGIEAVADPNAEGVALMKKIVEQIENTKRDG